MFTYQNQPVVYPNALSIPPTEDEKNPNSNIKFLLQNT